MVKALFVPKQFNTYADTFLILGVAQIAESALSQTRQKTEMQLIDEGMHYRLQFKTPVNLEAIKKLNYTNPFPPVCGAKSDRSSIPSEIIPFDTVEHSERRKLYRSYRFQSGGKTEWSEEAPQPPDPRTQNGRLLTLMSPSSDKNHNKLWYEGWQLKDYYGILVACLFQAFSRENPSKLGAEARQVATLFQQATGCKLPTQSSAIKVYMPTAVLGVCRVKADGNPTAGLKADWLSLWLIASGLFEFGISERVKLSDRLYDWRVLALDPKDISFDKYRQVLNTLRQNNPPGSGHGIARFDAELVLKFCQELLNYHQARAIAQPESELDFWEPVNHFVSGFRGTGFGSKGQVYGVKEIFTLGLPGWIRPENYDELLDYLTLLQEHLSVIISLEEGESELLNSYRDFIAGTHLRNFFPFQVGYAEYAVKRLANSQSRSPRLFTVAGLNIMTKKDRSFTEITKDPSFLRLAKAINQATVYAGKYQTKKGMIELDWQRQYGLAQQLSSQSGSKKEFISAIADFLFKYEAENLRLSEKLQNQGKKLKRVWPTKEDLDRLMELVEEFDTVLVANLLIAYGYANWAKPKDKQPVDSTDASSEAIDEIEDTETADFEG